MAEERSIPSVHRARMKRTSPNDIMPRLESKPSTDNTELKNLNYVINDLTTKSHTARPAPLFNFNKEKVYHENNNIFHNGLIRKNNEYNTKLWRAKEAEKMMKNVILHLRGCCVLKLDKSVSIIQYFDKDDEVWLFNVNVKCKFI